MAKHRFTEPPTDLDLTLMDMATDYVEGRRAARRLAARREARRQLLSDLVEVGGLLGGLSIIIFLPFLPELAAGALP